MAWQNAGLTGQLGGEKPLKTQKTRIIKGFSGLPPRADYCLFGDPSRGLIFPRRQVKAQSSEGLF
jgi:hypothetical protein